MSWVCLKLGDILWDFPQYPYALGNPLLSHVCPFFHRNTLCDPHLLGFLQTFSIPRMLRWYLTTYLNGIYEDRLLKCGWFCKHLATADHVDHLCIKCVGNTGKNHCSEVFEDKLQFLWKSHSSVYSLALPKQLYYRISDRNTLIQQFIYNTQTKMAAFQMVPISLLWCGLSPLSMFRKIWQTSVNYMYLQFGCKGS